MIWARLKRIDLKISHLVVGVGKWVNIEKFRDLEKREMNERKSSSAHADLDALNTPLLTFWKETRWWLTHPWINWLIIKYYEYSNLRFCIFTITSTILHQSEILEPIYILIQNLISLLRFFENFDSFGPKFRISQIGNYTQKQRSNIFGRKTGPVLTYLT